ncbi:MAG: substrate-binding domain-containing protein [bacterium]
MKRLMLIMIALGVGALAVVLGLGLVSPAPVPLSIVAGSENKTLEPLILDWAAQSQVALTITYLGSVDISRELEKGTAGAYDAVWPAHSLWIALGDTLKVTKHAESILRSPVVLGLKVCIFDGRHYRTAARSLSEVLAFGFVQGGGRRQFLTTGDLNGRFNVRSSYICIRSE